MKNIPDDKHLICADPDEMHKDRFVFSLYYQSEKPFLEIEYSENCSRTNTEYFSKSLTSEETIDLYEFLRDNLETTNKETTNKETTKKE